MNKASLKFGRRFQRLQAATLLLFAVSFYIGMIGQLPNAHACQEQTSDQSDGNFQEELEALIEEFEPLVEKWTWRSFVNEQPKGDSISKQWRVTAWPTTFLIDAEGVIRYRGLRGESLDAAIETLLAEIGEEVKIVGVDHEAEDEKAMEAFEKAAESETEESKSTDSGS